MDQLTYQARRKRMHRRKDDWKLWKNGWQYEQDAPKDKQWQKDRAKCFKKNGNGWWWFTPSITIWQNDDMR